MIKRIIIVLCLLSMSSLYADNPNDFNIFKFVGAIVEIPAYEEALNKAIDATKVVISDSKEVNDVIKLRNQGVELLRNMAPIAYHELRGSMPDLFTIKTYWDKYYRESIPYGNQGLLILADNKEAIIDLYIDFFFKNRNYQYKSEQLLIASKIYDSLSNKVTEIRVNDMNDFISVNNRLIEEACDSCNLEFLNEYKINLLGKMVYIAYPELIMSYPRLFEREYSPYNKEKYLNLVNDKERVLQKYIQFVEKNSSYIYINDNLNKAKVIYDNANKLIIEIKEYNLTIESNDARQYKSFIDNFKNSRKNEEIKKLLLEREKELVKSLKNLPNNQVEDNYSIYLELSQSFPDNETYKTKLNYFYQQKMKLDENFNKRFEEIKKLLARNIVRQNTIHNIVEALGEPSWSSYDTGVYGNGGAAIWKTNDGHEIQINFQSYDYVEFVLLDRKLVVSF